MSIGKPYFKQLTPSTGHSRNRDDLTTFTTGGNNYSYKYDPTGLRTKKDAPTGTTRYHYDNRGRVIAESNAGGAVTAQNIWGKNALARKVNGSYYYYVYNGHGDVVQVIDGSGNVVNNYKYDEWGNILQKTEGIANPLKYAGEYFDDESGLYYLMARYYDPTIGRFISRDSFGGYLNNPLSLNGYAYAWGNPLKYIDPSGCDVGWAQETDDAYYGYSDDTGSDCGAMVQTRESSNDVVQEPW